MAFVLDASVALSWCFQDEATAATDRLLALAADGERMHVPSHWPAEILNGAMRAARRGRLEDAGVSRFLELLPVFDIVVDQRSIAEQWSVTRPLVVRYRLSAYDASYLALAIILDVRLATFDVQLRLAASAEGVALPK